LKERENIVDAFAEISIQGEGKETFAGGKSKGGKTSKLSRGERSGGGKEGSHKRIGQSNSLHKKTAQRSALTGIKRKIYTDFEERDLVEEGHTFRQRGDGMDDLTGALFVREGQKDRTIAG